MTAGASIGVPSARMLYWHIYTYPTRAAAEAARGTHGTVVEVFGKHWLYTIAGDLPFSMDVDDHHAPGAPHSHWRPQGRCPK